VGLTPAHMKWLRESPGGSEQNRSQDDPPQMPPRNKKHQKRPDQIKLFFDRQRPEMPLARRVAEIDIGEIDVGQISGMPPDALADVGDVKNPQHEQRQIVERQNSQRPPHVKSTEQRFSWDA